MEKKKKKKIPYKDSEHKNQKKLDGWKQRAIIALLLILFAFIIYDIALLLYEWSILKYDRPRIDRVCRNPAMHSCEDLRYAAPYCRPARDALCSICSENCTIV